MTCILVVEDDDDIRDTLDGVFTSRGFTVLVARNGLDALDRVRDHGARPSLIILDLMMPGMDGEQFLAAQENEPLLVHVPVILSTAQLYVPDPLPAAVKTVLHKPMQLGDLLLAVDRCLIDSPTMPPPFAQGTGAMSPLTGPVPPRKEDAAEPDPVPDAAPGPAVPTTDPVE